LEELDIDGRVLKNGPGDVDWMNPAKGREKWRDVVKTVMNIRVT
jgi:hypothetical protein